MDWSYEIGIHESVILNAEQIIKDDSERISKLQIARKDLEERIATSKEKIKFLKSLNPTSTSVQKTINLRRHYGFGYW